MEIKKNEMDEKMEANTKDIIAGAYRFHETYYDQCLYIEGRMRDIYHLYAQNGCFNENS